MTADTLINLLFLAIAVVVFFRLRAALGKRTGNERPPHDPYASDRSSAANRTTTTQLTH
mgnify:CR=1 FL=1